MSLSHITCARVPKLLYTRVRASGMVVSDLQNTGEFGRFAMLCCSMPAVSLLPLRLSTTRGVRGGTIAGRNLLLIASKNSQGWKMWQKSKNARRNFCKLSPRKPESVCWELSSKICSGAARRSAERGSFTTARTHLSLSCTINHISLLLLNWISASLPFVFLSVDQLYFFQLVYCFFVVKRQLHYHQNTPFTIMHDSAINSSFRHLAAISYRTLQILTFPFVLCTWTW